MASPNGSPFARYAGPLAVIAGTLITLAQLVMLRYDPKDHVRTSQSVGFQIGGAIFMAGFVALLLAAIGAHERQNHKSGRLATVSAFAVVIGTMMLAGDLWFETFAIPWIADSPTADLVFESDPTVMLGLGALSSWPSRSGRGRVSRSSGVARKGRGTQVNNGHLRSRGGRAFGRGGSEPPADDVAGHLERGGVFA
jgi:hypothetical protein